MLGQDLVTWREYEKAHAMLGLVSSSSSSSSFALRDDCEKAYAVLSLSGGMSSLGGGVGVFIFKDTTLYCLYLIDCLLLLLPTGQKQEVQDLMAFFSKHLTIRPPLPHEHNPGGLMRGGDEEIVEIRDPRILQRVFLGGGGDIDIYQD